MTLDQLLDVSREAEPMDDAFVRLVMDDVHADVRRRSRMKIARRPVVVAVAAAVLATSGAVAALVGTYTSPKDLDAASPAPGLAQVVVSASPSVKTPSVTSSSGPAVMSGPIAAAPKTLKGHFSSLHTAWVIDDVTGLKLTTETYNNSFTTGKAQRVTLTLTNTGPGALLVSGLNSCGLQVVATPAGGNALAPSCASGGVSNGSVLLAPGGFYTAVANISLPKSGAWKIVGACTCMYSSPTQTLTQKNEPLTGLLDKAAPPVLMPGKKDAPSGGTAKLMTPAIGVVASR